MPGPLGLGAFSVGLNGGGGVVVVVVVVVVVDCSGSSLSLPHAAVKPIIARMAVPPTATEIRRRKPCDAILLLIDVF